MLTGALTGMLLLGVNQSEVFPISETTAHVGAAAGGAIIGAGTGFLTYSALQRQNLSSGWRTGLSITAGAAVGGLSWYLLYKALYTMTPKGRFEHAQKVVSSVESAYILNRNFHSMDEFEAAMNTAYSTNWPLIETRDKLVALKNDLLMARDFINLVVTEIRGDYSYGSLDQNCKDLLERATVCLEKIENMMPFILKNDKYVLQVQLYEKHMEAEREREHEQKLLAEKLS